MLQIGDPDLIRWFVSQVRDSAAEAGRDPHAVQVMAAAPAHVGDLADTRDRTRWFPAMVGNHVVDLVNKYPREDLPEELTTYIRDREGYDYLHHAEVGSDNSTFVSDDIVDRFCLVGSVDQHVGAPAGPCRCGRGPVQPVPHERRRGVAARDLRARDHPGAARRPGRPRLNPVASPRHGAPAHHQGPSSRTTVTEPGAVRDGGVRYLRPPMTRRSLSTGARDPATLGAIWRMPMPSLSLRRRDPWWESDGKAARRARRQRTVVSSLAFVAALAALGAAAFAWSVELGLASMIGVHARLPFG